MMLGAMALGILQMISIRFSDSIWNEFDAYIRTRSRSLPSERTVKHVIAKKLAKNFLGFAPHMILRKIRKRFFPRE